MQPREVWVKPLMTKLLHFAPLFQTIDLLRGTLGGYPTPKYRKKYWQIPKYCVKNRLNTDTAFMIGHVYASVIPAAPSPPGLTPGY